MDIATVLATTTTKTTHMGTTLRYRPPAGGGSRRWYSSEIGSSSVRRPHRPGTNAISFRRARTRMTSDSSSFIVRPHSTVASRRVLWNRTRNGFSYATICTPAVLMGGYLLLVGGNGHSRNLSLPWCQPTACEQATTATTLPLIQPDTDDNKTTQHLLGSWWRQVCRACKMMWRCAKLAITLSPVVMLYPVLWWNQRHMISPDPSMDAQDMLLRSTLDNRHGQYQANPWVSWYFQVCLTCVQSSGAAVIKLMQWAGSRPDMFGYEFCAIFSQLQDHTRPHAWRHTQRILEQSLGPQWQERIQLNPIPIGSGCIGQVYRGIVQQTNSQDEQPQEVAIKVLHPQVHEDIEADLDLMRLLVRIVDQTVPFWTGTPLTWHDLPKIVEDFARLLTVQLDMRTEASNLQRFQDNFADVDHIIFPQVVSQFTPSRDLLVETYHEGKPLLQFARENQQDRNLLSDLCFKAMECVCKMVFLDNFVHGTCTLETRTLYPTNLIPGCCSY